MADPIEPGQARRYDSPRSESASICPGAVRINAATRHARLPPGVQIGGIP
jgi:hypothetical protein